MTEPHEQVKNGNVLKFLKDYWFIVAFIFSTAYAWSELRAQVHANDMINQKQDIKIESLDQDLNVLDKRYIEDVSIIKTKLDQLNKKP